MSTVNLTQETIDDAIGAPGITLIDWWAEWCGPCKQFGPIFEAASENHPDITFAKIDTEDQQALAQGAQITSIPTLMAFRDGVLVYAQPGAQPAAALEQLITAVKELDMDEVHRQVAEAEASESSDAE